MPFCTASDKGAGQLSPLIKTNLHPEHMESGRRTRDSRRWAGKHVEAGGEGEEDLCDPYEDAGRIYGAVCGVCLAAGERPPLESSGQFSGAEVWWCRDIYGSADAL